MENKKETEVVTVKNKKKSNKKVYVSIAIIIVVLIIVVFLNNRNSEVDLFILENNIVNKSKQQLESVYQTKVDSQANVTIEVTPQVIGIEMQENIFELLLDTHSVDLNYDLQKIIILRDDLGNIYEASAWTGGIGGHHLVGKIVFPSIDKDAKAVELEINGLGEVKRMFQWDI